MANRRESWVADCELIAMDPAEFPTALAELSALYGPQSHPAGADPLHQLLWESAGYLCTDERRLSAFNALRDRVGFEPEAILATSPDLLWEIAALGGIHPDIRAGRMREIAEIALDEFHGDLYSACKLPLKQAMKSFQRFGGIAEPGAAKVLLFARAFPLLPFDSNGLRTSMRLLGAADSGNYCKDYKTVQSVLAPVIGEDFEALEQAYLLLRTHGKTICKTNGPLCDECPLSDRCEWYTRLHEV
ncbi:MAG: hypothetical protein ABJA67_00900 [Chthonomonadales bacterium]